MSLQLAFWFVHDEAHQRKYRNQSLILSRFFSFSKQKQKQKTEKKQQKINQSMTSAQPYLKHKCIYFFSHSFSRNFAVIVRF